MITIADRMKILGRVATAHIFGLSVTGCYGTIGTTAGFNVISGSFWGIFIGGLISLPWAIPLLFIAWIQAAWLERHPMLFSIFGPPLVIGSYALIGMPFLESISISAISSSAFYLFLHLLQSCRSGTVDVR